MTDDTGTKELLWLWDLHTTTVHLLRFYFMLDKARFDKVILNHIKELKVVCVSAIER